MPAGKWYVLKNIPTYFEIGAHNAVELYEWDETKKRVQVTFWAFPDFRFTSPQLSFRTFVCQHRNFPKTFVQKFFHKWRVWCAAVQPKEIQSSRNANAVVDERERRV